MLLKTCQFNLRKLLIRWNKKYISVLFRFIWINQEEVVFVPVGENYKAGMERFCKREFGVDIGDACRMALKNAYKGAWE